LSIFREFRQIGILVKYWNGLRGKSLFHLDILFSMFRWGAPMLLMIGLAAPFQCPGVGSDPLGLVAASYSV
jgi:hypothetical protein